MSDVNVNFSLSISHTPWVPERVESLRKLKHQLFPDPNGPVSSNTITLRAPNWLWSEAMWNEAAENAEGASHHLFLQDDVHVVLSFWAILHALVSAQPDQLIGLHTVHPAAATLGRAQARWMTTSDGLVGVGYVFPHSLLKEFLGWRASRLRPHAWEEVNEDTLIGLWCLDTGRRIYHPIPTIIDHQVNLKSTYGNDSHSNRRSQVVLSDAQAADPKFQSREYWASPPRHLGRMYQTSPFELQKILPEPDKELLRRNLGDTGHREVVRMNAERRARGAIDPVRIFLATPTHGGLSPEYTQSVFQLLRDEDIEITNPFEITDIEQRTQDLVRVRSRIVHNFLHMTDCTHLLFVDADCQFWPKTIKGMLRAMTPERGEPRHLVASPYPRRDSIDWKRVRELTQVPPEAAAYRYSVRFDGDRIQVTQDGCAEVKGIGLGCALISRRLLEHLECYYAEDVLDYEDMARKFATASWPETMAGDRAQLLPSLVDFAQYVAKAARERAPLEFLDETPGAPHLRPPMTAMFNLKFEDGGLLSEDYSFCSRVRELGYKVWMYLGDGSPVNHSGEWLFQGNVEAFGVRRV